MKKVLLISNNGQGFYNFKKELVERLVMENFEVHFSVPSYEKLTDLQACGAIYHELSIYRRGMNPIRDLTYIRSLQKIFKKVHPDVVLLHTIKPNIYGGFLAIQGNIPYINNITGLGTALQIDNFLAKILRGMYRFSLRKTNAVFFENKGNRDYFQKYNICKPSRCVVVNGAGVNTQHCMAKRQRKFGGQSTKAVIFLYIARIMKDKGIEEYLQAAQTIKGKYPDVRFQILGYYDDERYKIEIERLEEADILEYLGVSDDTREQMERADCIVLPSYHEGMSNVLLEGASFGLPLITTNISGCKEAVEDGVTGFLCEPRSKESLEKALGQFLALSDEKRVDMGQRGREKMIREFNREFVIEKYIEAIENAFRENIS